MAPKTAQSVNHVTKIWPPPCRMEVVVSHLLFLVIFSTFMFVNHGASEEDVIEDLLIPYLSYHGSAHNHRTIRSLQPPHYAGKLHEDYPTPFIPIKAPLIENYPFVKSIGNYWDQRDVSGRYFVVNHPVETLSVLEPGGKFGCAKKNRSKVQATAASKRCLLASNAGFFNTTSGACIGDVVSDGREAQNSGGVQNAHFGIRKDGTLFFGYIPEDLDLEAEFSQLVSGVIWLVRDGRSFVDVSLRLESPKSQETGSLEYFANVISARMVIGNDRQGRVILVYVDGKTGSRGVNLYEFADLLVSWDIVNAINLDGGGSASAVVNGTYVNYPSDIWKRNNSKPKEVGCSRAVSTIICVHEPECLGPNCNNHGDCVLGRCRCHGNWVGEACESLSCGHLNCSGHGDCTAAGCLCFPGWYGEDCHRLCPHGFFGLNCSSTCRCGPQSLCDPVNGQCHCRPGYTGLGCDQECPPGTYGHNCRSLCYCDNSCLCHHVAGKCNVSMGNSKIAQVGYCLVNQLINERHLVTDQSDQFRMWLLAIIVISILAAGSLVLNISLLCMGFCQNSVEPKKEGDRRYKRQKRTYQAAVFNESSSEDETSGPILR